MGKKPNMSPKHQTPDQPVPDAEKRHQSVVDTRASAADDPQPGSMPQQAADPELQAARDEAEATFARYQRLAADFENYKRRTRQELADRTQYANEELLRKLLPILDGIKLVARQFEETLQAQGLTTIPAVGEMFDPSQHEAIAREETDEHEEGTVVEEMQPGYRLHERVLRPTLVKVAHPRALKS